jgi:hypothetical protein
VEWRCFGVVTRSCSSSRRWHDVTWTEPENAKTHHENVTGILGCACALLVGWIDARLSFQNGCSPIKDEANGSGDRGLPTNKSTPGWGVSFEIPGGSVMCFISVKQLCNHHITVKRS